MDIANTTTLKSINVATKLSQKESGGIMLTTLCSAPSIIITAQVTTAQVMAGIPTIRKRMKSFPFMVAKHLLSLVDSA